jgi:hypothetical protein
MHHHNGHMLFGAQWYLVLNVHLIHADAACVNSKLQKSGGESRKRIRKCGAPTNKEATFGLDDKAIGLSHAGNRKRNNRESRRADQTPCYA